MSKNDEKLNSYVYEDYKIISPEYDQWKCYLFGSDLNGLVWIPTKGNVPNWFHRKMQYIFFGNKWVKNV